MFILAKFNTRNRGESVQEYLLAVFLTHVVSLVDQVCKMRIGEL